MQLEKSLFEIPAIDFEAHLKILDNHRILFSGKFGKGKTTFLRTFFDSPELLKLNHNYFPIYLNPINYSIASNEDVFKYIKYDIIIELIRKGIHFENFDASFKETLSYYVYKYPEKIVGKIVSFIPKVGKTFEEIQTKCLDLIKEVKEYKNRLEEKSEEAVLETYLEAVENNGGSLYEEDFITKIIEKKIADLKEERREVVLIIDDLDRIDPEHIFRILNLFAAHFDSSNFSIKENKFGFSKIILVSDLENIRNIYINKYGANVDFLGYIDKFYSKSPFYFNNFEQLKNIANGILEQIVVKNFRGASSYGEFSNNRNGLNIFPIIHFLLFYNIISLRTLISFCSNHSFNGKKSYLLFNNSCYGTDSSIVEDVNILISLLGGYHATLNTLDRVCAYKNISGIQSFEISSKMVLGCLANIFRITIFQAALSKHEIYIEGERIMFTVDDNNIASYIDINNGATFPRNEKDYFKLLKYLIELLYTQHVLQLPHQLLTQRCNLTTKVL